jgi:glycosyltransferase involved in cell wall biosynthesis
MTTKKVLLIIPELTMGGAQRSLSKLSVELARRYKVWILIFNRKHTIAYNYGGELISLDVVPGPGMINKAVAFLQRVRRLKEIKKTIDVDVSISFLEGADYINVLSKSGEKVVLSIRGSKEHDETIHGKYSWLRKKILIPFLYKRADEIIAVNNGIVSELVRSYGLEERKKIVIGNYYDIQEIVELSNNAKSEAVLRLYSDPVMITTGRFAPEKGLNQLLEVFGRLKKEKYPNLRLVMLGDGPEYNNLVSTIRRLGLVHHVGLDFNESPDVLIIKNEKNVFKYLRGATVYLMNSSSEGFPNGLAEAMICDVPVVSSDCPYGPREIMEPNHPFPTDLPKPYTSTNGVLMPNIRTANDSQIWVDTLAHLIADKELRLKLAKNARQRIALFDKDSIISQWHKVLEGK